MGTWRHGDGDMEIWRHGDMEMETWKHGDMETSNENGNPGDFP
jgi:hypothetical protein